MNGVLVLTAAPTSIPYSAESMIEQVPQTTIEIAGKVLRRAEIAKVARNLQDRLALANFKAQNGWQGRALSTLETEVTERLRRKRPYSSGDVLSDCSSSLSDELPSLQHSSPLTSPTIVGDPPRSVIPSGREPPIHAFKRQKKERSVSNASATFNARGRALRQPTRLAQSSPLYPRPKTSFVSTDSAILPIPRHAPPLNLERRGLSLDRRPDDLQLHNFTRPSSPPTLVPSSPPRTPSPNPPPQNPGHEHRRANTKPAQTPTRALANPPSTPPSQKVTIDPDTSLALPSSFLSTPGTSTSAIPPLFSTPGQQFNFADFVNVTPSPAQAPWGGKTPNLSKTPAASTRAAAARRSLNFDALVPPAGLSPQLTRKGLALDLGGKLMPRV